MSAPSTPPLPLQQPTHDHSSTASHLIQPPPTSTVLQPASSPSVSPSSPPSSILGPYLAAGAALLTVGVLFGVRLGNRQAAQLERDNPPPTHTLKPRPQPPITPQQRTAAFRATIGALGLGTLLCAGFGSALVWGVGRYWAVNDTREFAVRMDSVVADQRRKWLGSMTSSLPSQVAGVRSSIAGTQLGRWIRSRSSVSDAEQGQLTPQETKEVEQAVDFLKQLEVEYQQFVADAQKRRQAQAEVADIERSRKT